MNTQEFSTLLVFFFNLGARNKTRELSAAK